MRFTLNVNPDETQTLLQDFKSFAENFTQPAQKALLHSMIAEMYAMFYNNNRWIINRRTPIEGFIPGNIAEWTRNIFFDKIVEELKLSLEAKTILQRTNITPFIPLISEGAHGAIYQPTLFDFLGQRAVTILQRLENISLATNPLQSDADFSPAQNFVNLVSEKEFAQSRENLIIDIYQQLILFRLQDSQNIPALIFIDLQRLDFVRSSTQNLDADELFENALLALKNQYIESEAVIEVMSRLANFYLQKSRTGIQDDADYYRRKAYNIASDGINRFPDYKRINLLKRVVQQIALKNININFPTIATPGSEMKITVTSRNISELQLDIYRVNSTAQNYFRFIENNGNRPYRNRRLIETKNLSITPNEIFGTDTTEFIIQVPKYGIYEFTVMERDRQVNSGGLAHGGFISSDFMLLHRSGNEWVARNSRASSEIFVLDRVSGNVIEGVNVVSRCMEWFLGRERYIPFSRTRSRTDKNGFVKKTWETARWQPAYFLSKGSDRYFFSDISFRRIQNQTSPSDDIEVSFFTDRSLYRPGQTVYFKGIAFQRQSQVVAENETFEVRLFDANRQEIEKIEVRTNDFGSFSGEFILPRSGLNGAFRLEARLPNNERDGFSTTFFVEEYRRPTFEILIERPENEVFFGEKVNFTGTVRA
jgi:hypothetical protein